MPIEYKSYQRNSVIRVPSERPLTVRVCDFSRIVQGTSACSPVQLVDVEPGVHKAMEHIRELAGKECSLRGEFRVPPVVFSSMARSGKTTFLSLLFDQLKEESYAPIMISFNGNFVRNESESHCHAILRLIVGQMIAVTEKEITRILITDEDAVFAHLNESSDGRPIILLIDELNMLAATNSSLLDAEASKLLKMEFLDKLNRYLVFTTHVPMDLDIVNPASTFMIAREKIPESSRDVLTVPLPFCLDLVRLRSMSAYCETLTGAEVAIYSGIPSIIFSSKMY